MTSIFELLFTRVLVWHIFSFGNEFDLQTMNVLGKLFQYERLCTLTRFETEVETTQKWIIFRSS